MRSEKEEVLPSWAHESDTEYVLVRFLWCLMLTLPESTKNLPFSVIVLLGREEHETAPLIGDNIAWNNKEKGASSYDAVAIVAQESEDVDSDDGPEAPRKNIFLHIFGLFEMFAIVTCTRVLLMQLLPFLFLPLKEIGFLQMVLR